MFSVPQLVRHKPTGKLLITRQFYPATAHHGAVWHCQPANDRHCSGGYPLDELEPAPPHTPGGFDFDTEIVPRVQGALPWEHIERAPLAVTLSNMACCAGWTVYPHVGWLTKPGEAHPSWARYFLHHTQAGEYTGEAHALVYEGTPYGPPTDLRAAVVAAAVRAVHDKHAPAGDLAAAVLAMEAKPYAEPAMPSAWRVRICAHEVIEDAGANHMRGWHPAHCSKCGLNLSVDSGD